MVLMMLRLVIVAITILVCVNAVSECPTWTLPSHSNKTEQVCHCGNSVGGQVRCDEDLNVSVLMGDCMTYSAKARMAYLSACPFRLQHNYEIYTAVPKNVSELNQFFCLPYNRRGMVCSECKPGYGPSVYTHNLKCYKCSGLYSGWALYLFFELFPVTILFCIMALCHIRLTSSAANCLLFNAQMIVAVLSYGAHVGAFPFGQASTILTKILLTAYGIFNLDFFREVVPPFCVDEHINGLHSIALQYLAVVYLLLLTLSVYFLLDLHYRGSKVTMWIWKTVIMRLIRVKQKWTFRTSLADSLATCLLLSYTRLMLVSFNLLYPVSVFNEHGDVAKKTSNFQQNIEFLSVQHIPFVLLALFVLVLLVVLPPLLFIIYPTNCCQKRRRFQNVCKKFGIRHLVERFQGCFKDGTDNTRDYRWFAIFYFTLRFVMFVTHIIGYGGKPRTSFLLPAVVLLCASLTILILRPYKKNLYNNIDGIMLACAAIILFFQSVMILIPNTIEGELLQIIIQIGFFLPLFFAIIYCVYLAIIWVSHHRVFRKDVLSPDDLPDRLINPHSYTDSPPTPNNTWNTGNTYGSINSTTATEQ